MASNAEAAELLRAIADLLDLTGEKFKPEAYRRAARSVETLPESLAQYAKRGQLREIPGVGEAIAEKLRELLDSGRISYLDRLQQEIPAGVVELMRLPGLGPKTARRLWTEFRIESPAALRTAIDQGRLVGAKGFGERKLEQFREASGAKPAGARIPITQAYPLAQAMLEELRRGLKTDERAEVAGSLRRFRETIGDVDLLVGSARATAIFDTAASGAEIAQVVLRGDTKMTVRLKSGLQVDIRVVAPAAFGAALQYFTGSKEHNIRLRSIARDLALKLNEYGVYRGEELLASRTEFDVYDAVGLSWIPPEMREDRGEIDLAATDSIPALVEGKDLRGDVHWHPPPDATPDDVDRALAEARRRRLDYVGIVVAGVDAAGRPVHLAPEVEDRLTERRTRRRPGEATILRLSEELPTAVAFATEEVDARVLRATAGRPPADSKVPPGAIALTHLGSAPADATAMADWRGWLAFARRHGLSVEVGPESDQLNSDAARELCGLGGTLLVATGFGRAATDALGPVSLGFARRAWATAGQVRNTALAKDLHRPALPDRRQDATMRSSARRARAATSGRTSMT